jgi:hypothetical protein
MPQNKGVQVVKTSTPRKQKFEKGILEENKSTLPIVHLQL